jgi:hypothetical protein
MLFLGSQNIDRNTIKLSYNDICLDKEEISEDPIAIQDQESPSKPRRQQELTTNSRYESIYLSKAPEPSF